VTYTRNDMPMVLCPNCDQEFQWDDYYDIAPGKTRECMHCHRELVVIDVDTTIECRIGVKNDDAG
jgi:hypothetical protein